MLALTREFFETWGGNFPISLILCVNTVHYRNSEWNGNQIAEKDFGTEKRKRKKVDRK